jgi:hypothetical protein
VGENPRESLSELARLVARLIIQHAVEDEFDAFRRTRELSAAPIASPLRMERNTVLLRAGNTPTPDGGSRESTN